MRHLRQEDGINAQGVTGHFGWHRIFPLSSL
nr:MAG TPA: hypothetical protein [Caudoviricetes sp.]